MLALIGSGLGFFTSFLPSVMKYFQAKQDQRHELMLMDKQLEQQKVAGEQKLDMVVVDAQAREIEALHKEHASITRASSQWVVNLSATVRPLITYFFFLELILLTVALFFKWITSAEYSLIWDEPMQAIWAAVITFWFGQRTFGKK